MKSHPSSDPPKCTQQLELPLMVKAPDQVRNKAMGNQGNWEAIVHHTVRQGMMPGCISNTSLTSWRFPWSSWHACFPIVAHRVVSFKIYTCNESLPFAAQTRTRHCYTDATAHLMPEHLRRMQDPPSHTYTQNIGTYLHELQELVDRERKVDEEKDENDGPHKAWRVAIGHAREEEARNDAPGKQMWDETQPKRRPVNAFAALHCLQRACACADVCVCVVLSTVIHA